jgi:hypothetical protein
MIKNFSIYSLISESIERDFTYKYEDNHFNNYNGFIVKDGHNVFHLIDEDNEWSIKCIFNEKFTDEYLSSF